MLAALVAIISAITEMRAELRRIRS